MNMTIVHLSEAERRDGSAAVSSSTSRSTPRFPCALKPPARRDWSATQPRSGFILVSLLVLILANATVNAQWATQTISLQPGWNAVFLEVQPEPRECDAVLTNLPIESVWFWNRRFNAVQFIQDPETLVPGDPDWLAWFPPNAGSRAALSLHALLGGRAYLIKVTSNSQAFAWSVRGNPTLRPPNWQSDSLNFVGFPVSAQNPPTFAAFFAGAPAHEGQPVYELTTAGHWERVAFPASSTLENGRAYWIGCRGPSTFAGPVAVQLEQSTGLNYGRALAELTLRLRNASSLPRSLSVRKLPSANPPPGPYPPQAGDVSLAYFHMDLARSQYGWIPLSTTLEKLDVPPGEEWLLRLEVRRAEMPASGNPAAVYQSLLEISDDYGVRVLVPVTAQSSQASSTALAGATAGPAGAPPLPHKHAGLWLGSVSINKVSQPASLSQPATPQPVAAEFQFRLLVHVDASGQARLLQKVLQMWKNGTTRPDPLDPTRQIVDVPGRFVLLTDETLVPSFSGAALRDGVPVGRRVSSSAFSFKSPLPLSGSGEFGGNTISCQIPLPYDDPLNPFLHRYHPDHNNLDERFEQTLPAGVESFNLTRQVALQFTAQPPDGLALAGWGDTQLGGAYRETISGVHRQPIYVEGLFRLQKASTVASLNDQN
jgi:hypothetical protein